jgi:MFS family permease
MVDDCNGRQCISRDAREASALFANMMHSFRGSSSMSAEKLPRGVIMLGLVSLCMDTSSELIHSLLPVFLVAGLGVSPLMLGVIEGIAEATASITKLFSGALSDRIARRKPLLLAGYGLAALSKPLFPLADTAFTVLFARFVDRIGKGIRGAPRDALVADITPAPLLGAAYGMRQSLDTVGAITGPLLAVAMMGLFAGNVRAVLWVSVIPAVCAVALIVYGVPDSRVPHHAGRRVLWPRRADLRALPHGYWLALAVAVLLTLARFSEAFLLLRASELGMAMALVPLVLAIMNVVYAASAYPIGVLSDRMGRKRLLACGIALLVLADLVLARVATPWHVGIGALLWGLHMGATQGLLATLVADTAPAHLRGSAFGLQHFASGVSMLTASVVAGLLWTRMGAGATFITGAVFASLALLFMFIVRAPPLAPAGEKPTVPLPLAEEGRGEGSAKR